MVFEDEVSHKNFFKKSVENIIGKKPVEVINKDSYKFTRRV